MSEDTKAVTGEVIPAGQALEAIARGEVDMQVATAKRYPRSVGMVRERILELATQDQAVAEECWYALPRGGKVIEGPSVRLAEIVAASYGNLYAAARHVATDDTHVTVEGAAWDLENNVRVVVQVKRRITKRSGLRYDDDLIGVTINAACSIALRNAIFKVVPKALLAGVTQEIKKVAMGDERTLAERRKAVLAYFKGLGVSEKRLLDFVGRQRLDDLTLEDLATFTGIRTAIKDQETTVEEAFGPGREPPAVGKVDPEAIRPAEPEAPPPSEDVAGRLADLEAAVAELTQEQVGALPETLHGERDLPDYLSSGREVVDWARSVAKAPDERVTLLAAIHEASKE